MSMELLRLGLQFFAEGEDEEEETETPYMIEGTGSKTSYGDYMVENNRVDENTYYANNNYLGTQKEWEDYYGYDADRDYQNTVNTLNYEYQTSMANYGENAEKMYQMGLQNSGVSDIFQANAFSAYLGNMNKAAADRINLKNQYKRDYARYKDDFKKGWTDYDAITQSGYKSYSDNYDSTLKTNAINGYTAVLSSGLFSGEGIEGYEATEGASVGAGFKDYHKVSNYLKNLGYDDVTIEEVWKKLARMDLAGLTTDRINAGYLNSMDIYDGSKESETRLRTTLAAMKLTESEIDQIVTRHKDEWNASDDGKAAAVNNFVTTYGEQFDPNMSKEEFVNKMITKEDGTLDESQRANAEAAWEQMKTDYEAKQPERVQGYVNELYGAYQGHSNTDWGKYLANVPEGDREAVKQAILEQWRSDVKNAGAAIQDYIYKLGLDYTGTETQKDDIKRTFGLDFNNHVIDYVLKSIDSTLGVYKEGYEDSPEGIQASVDELVNSYGAQFDPNYSSGNAAEGISSMDDFIKNVMQVETDPNAEKFDQAAYDRAVKAWEQMSADYKAKQPERVQAIVDTFGIGEGKIDPSAYSNREEFVAAMVENGYNAEDSGAAWDNFNNVAGKAYEEVWAKYQAVDDTGALINKYTGDAKQKHDIKNLLGADVPEYIYNEVIKRMDANRAEEKKADKQVTLTEIEDLPENKVNYNTLYNEIQNSGNDPDITAASSVKLKDAVMGVLNDDSGEKLANAYELIPNMTKQTWDALDDAGKLDALLNGIGEAHKAGVMMGEEYYSVISSWIDEELKNSDNNSSLVSIVDKLEQYKDAGYMSGYYYKDYFDKIAESFTLDSKNTYDTLLGTGPNNTTIRVAGEDYLFTKCNVDKGYLRDGIKVGGGTMYAINGYQLLFVTDNGKCYVSGTPSNTTAFDLAIKSIEGPKTVNTVHVTPGGDSTSDNFKVGNQSGGRTTDFANENK